MRGLRYIAPAFVAFALAPVASESASAAPDPTGIWMNDTGRGAVEIKPCGNALCGNVVWVKAATDASGCGKQIIGDVAPVGGGRWDNGWIYSPEKGRKYDVELDSARQRHAARHGLRRHEVSFEDDDLDTRATGSAALRTNGSEGRRARNREVRRHDRIGCNARAGGVSGACSCRGEIRRHDFGRNGASAPSS